MKVLKLLLPLFLFAQIHNVAAAAIDSSKSTVTAIFKQEGVEVPAKFTRVSGDIDFNSANPAGGKARIVVETASFDLGEPEYSKEVQKREWFNSTQFPQATFVSSAITQTAPGKLSVQGKLTIKGKAFETTIPITFKQDGKTQVFEGQLPIKRLYFNIGEGEWKETDTLADDVLVKFRIVSAN